MNISQVRIFSLKMVHSKLYIYTSHKILIEILSFLIVKNYIIGKTIVMSPLRQNQNPISPKSF